MEKQSTRILVMASASIILVGVLVSGSRIWGEPEEIACSNRTLRGDYGFAIEGQILGGPRAGPVRGVAMTHFDGQGNLTQVDNVVVNGILPSVEWSPGNGVYMLSPDCTGMAQIDFTDGRPTVLLSLVAVSQGREIRTVVDGPGQASSSIGIRRDSLER